MGLAEVMHLHFIGLCRKQGRAGFYCFLILLNIHAAAQKIFPFLQNKLLVAGIKYCRIHAGKGGSRYA